MTEVDTKTLILNTAQKMFSEYGYNGVSIRDVASKSNLNVAAVNYHFGQKSELYFQVLENAFCFFHSEIESLCLKHSSIKPLISELFDKVIEHKEIVVSTFRSSMEEKNICKKELGLRLSKKTIFPPGKEPLELFFANQLNKNKNSKQIKWLVRGINFILLQNVMMMHSVCFSALQSIEPEEMTIGNLKKSFLKYVQAMIHQITI